MQSRIPLILPAHNSEGFEKLGTQPSSQQEVYIITPCSPYSPLDWLDRGLHSNGLCCLLLGRQEDYRLTSFRRIKKSMNMTD
ncbi:Solute Carrier Family 23 Member 1 [Manis pentadactyla]|nr:Solute Carrier Family 23 Member 1 [Manis pentadactyla]